MYFNHVFEIFGGSRQIHELVWTEGPPHSKGLSFDLQFDLCGFKHFWRGWPHVHIYIYNYLLNKGHGSCVCNNWIDVKFLLFSFSFFSPFNKAGGPSMYCERWSNEAATVHADITADHRDVPAFFMSFFCNGTWLTREPPSQFCQLRCHLMLCTFSAICFSTIFSDVLTSFFEVCILVWSTYDIFGKTFIVLAKYRHEIYFGSNCLGWLHVTGLSSGWISSKTPIVSSVIPTLSIGYWLQSINFWEFWFV